MVVGDSAVALTLVVGDVLVVVFGIVEDDVPGVDHTREEAQTAESEVDEGIGTANTLLDPDYLVVLALLPRTLHHERLLAPSGTEELTSNRREEEGEEHEKAVCAAHLER